MAAKRNIHPIISDSRNQGSVNLQQINEELDDYYYNIPKRLDDSRKQIWLTSDCEKLRDMFRVHLHNQRNEHNVLMDEKTIESLKEFNENVFNLLDSYKCSSGTSNNSCINSESSLEELVINFSLSIHPN